MKTQSHLFYILLLACTTVALFSTPSVQAATGKCYIFQTGYFCFNSTTLYTSTGSINMTSIFNNNYTTGTTFTRLGNLVTLTTTRNGMSNLVTSFIDTNDTAAVNALQTFQNNIYVNVTNLQTFQNNIYTNVSNLQSSNTSIWNDLAGKYTNITALQNSVGASYTNITNLQTQTTTLNNTKAGIGNCSANQVVMNTTIGGVQCVPMLADNSSWNQILADTLYYAINNPYGFYNSTTLPPYPTGDNTSWNQIIANTLYSPISIYTNVSALQTFRDNIYTNVSNLQTFNNNIYNNVSTLQSNVSNLGVRADTLNNTKLNTTDQRYNDSAAIASIGNYSAASAGLYTNITNLQTQTNTLNNTANGAYTNITNLQTFNNNIYTNVSNLQNSNTTTNQRIDTLNTTTQGQYTNITALQTYRDANYINVTGLQSSNTSIWSDLNGKYTNISNLQTQTTTLNSTLNSAYTNITNLQSYQAGSYSNITSLQTFRDNVYINVTTLQNNVSNLGVRIDTLNSTTQGQYNNITNLQNNVSNLGSRVDSLNNTKLNVTDQRYNDTALINALNASLATTIYNASSVQTITGTPQGTLADIQTYNDISYNVSESASDLELIVNFTGVPTFNQVIVRYQTIAGETHIMNVELWDYNSSTWEGYNTLGTTEGIYNVKAFGVFDPNNHVSGGIVRVRFSTTNPGGSTDKWRFDWVAVSNGIATPSTTETDPLSVHKDGSTPLTNNWNAGAYNITANNFIGNLTTDSILVSGGFGSTGITMTNGDYWGDGNLYILGNLTASNVNMITVNGSYAPIPTNTWNMGNSTNLWAGVYATNFYEGGTALSSKYLGINSVAVNSHQLDGNGSAYYYPASNPNGYINSYTETDPRWLASLSNYVNTTAGVAYNSHMLDGNLSTYYLSTTGVAANSHQLDGNASTYYSIKSQTDGIYTNVSAKAQAGASVACTYGITNFTALAGGNPTVTCANQQGTSNLTYSLIVTSIGNWSAEKNNYVNGTSGVAFNSHQLDGNLSTYYSIKSQTDTLAANITAKGNVNSTNGTADYIASFTANNTITAKIQLSQLLNVSGFNAGNITSGTISDARLSTNANNITGSGTSVQNTLAVWMNGTYVNTGNSTLQSARSINITGSVMVSNTTIILKTIPFYTWYYNSTLWDCVNATGTIYNRGNSTLTCS